VLHRRWTFDVYLLGMFFVRVCSFSLLLSSSPRKMRRTEEGSGSRTTRNNRGGFSLTRRSPVGQEDMDTMTPIFATQDRLRQVDVGKNKRSLPANRLDLSFPYRSLLDFGLVADAGAVAWFCLWTDEESAQQELGPISLRDYLPVSTSSLSYPHSHPNPIYILRCLTLCERRNHPPLREER
jgi:hypothetical protein